MADHSASVTVNAPVHQVYSLYSHFNDYPKFMSFVKEVTYLDDQHSHWVVDVVGRHEWDAVNVGWIPDQEIGWRSVDGLENSGRVTFESLGTGETRVTVAITYVPPAGLLGQIGEALGAGGAFELRLQTDLQHFATMVDQAPPGALDPTSSAYLFHDQSAAAKGTTTRAQNESMGMTEDASRDVPAGTPENVRSTSAVTGAPVSPNVEPADEAMTDPTIPRVPGTSAARDV